MFRLMTIAFILFMGNIAQAQRLDRYNATIKIWADKYELLEFEDVAIRILVENFDEKGPRVNYEITSDLIITDNQGKKILPNSSLNTVSGSNMGIEKREYVVRLLARYGSATEDYLRYLPPGQYTIFCRWDTRYYEPIISNQIQINIIPPSGEDKTALEEYRKAQSLFDQKNWKLYEERLDDIITRFPNTPYAARAVNDKIFVYHYVKFDEEGFIAMNKQLVEKFPDSPGVQGALREIFKYYDRKNKMEEGILYFNELVGITINSRLEQEIQQAKAKIEAEKKPVESIQTNQEIEVQRQ